VLRSIRTICFCLGSLTLTACPGSQAVGPDLIGQSVGKDAPNLCELLGPNDQLQVVITVKNIGDANAGASVTSVQFTNVSNATSFNTPAIPPNSPGVKITVPVPPNCGGANCAASFTVNANNAVSESSSAKQNNMGSCIARIG
jgi:hypothetical protein